MLINRWQTTLQRTVTFTGKGLHSGRLVRMILRPAPASSGIRFTRTDGTSPGATPASAEHVSGTMLGTSVGEGSRSIGSVQQLMAAFAGLGLVNADVYLNGPEIPSMDGSAGEFVRGILQGGLVEQYVPALAYRLRKALEVRDGDRIFRLQPTEKQHIDCTIDFRTPFIGVQSREYGAELESFMALADARNFCHLNDVMSMREKGLALGGGLDNALVVTETGILNHGGLRYPDEFVRYKILDIIGDLYLLGAPLLAKVYAYKSGHALHVRAVETLMNQRDIYLEEFSPAANLPSFDRAHQNLLHKMSSQYA